MIARVTDPVKELVAQAIARAGGLVEESDHALSALLPGELAHRLRVPENTTVAFHRVAKPSQDTVLASLGSPFLDELIALLRDRGAATRMRLDGLYLKREGLIDAVARTMSFPNAKPLVQRGVETWVSYVVLHFHYQAVSETREEGILALCLNEVSLADLPALVDHPALVDAHPNAFAEPAARRAFGEILGCAKTQLARVLGLRLQPYRAALERRRARDHQRTLAYYGQLIRETEHPRRRSRAPEAAQVRADKVLATRAARDAKIADLNARYAVTVTVRALAAKRVLLPTVAIPTILQHGKQHILRRFFWNAVLKDVEPTACDHCGITTRVALVSDAGQLVCKNCS